jgi:ribulose-5-phosphate 4-epimerase/fuculose-1-phosphate aldolase
MTCVRLAADRGLTAGTLAEASRRLDEEKFIITALGCWAANINEEDLKIASTNDRWVVDQETMPRHAAWHRLLYRETAAGAVLLSQPAAALVIAARRLSPAPELLADAAADIGEISIFEPGAWEELAQEIGEDETTLKQIISERHALLLSGSGLLTWGETLEQAVARAEAVERWCEITLRFHDTHE